MCTSLQITKPIILAMPCLPKPSFIKNVIRQRSCLASQLNIVDHVTSYDHKHLPTHFWAHACHTSSDQ